MTPHEAAARAWFDRQESGRMDAGRFRDDGQPWQWEDLTDHDRKTYLALVKPIVDAALNAERSADTEEQQ